MAAPPISAMPASEAWLGRGVEVAATEGPLKSLGDSESIPSLQLEMVPMVAGMLGRVSPFFEAKE